MNFGRPPQEFRVSSSDRECPCLLAFREASCGYAGESDETHQEAAKGGGGPERDVNADSGQEAGEGERPSEEGSRQVAAKVCLTGEALEDSDTVFGAGRLLQRAYAPDKDIGALANFLAKMAHRPTDDLSGSPDIRRRQTVRDYPLRRTSHARCANNEGSGSFERRGLSRLFAWKQSKYILGRI